MGKTTWRDILYAAVAGLVIGLVPVVYIICRVQTRLSGAEEILVIAVFHEVWLLDILFNVDFTFGGAMIAHVIYDIIFAMVAMALYRYFRPIPPTNFNACQTCHYDLTGNESGTCPECGTAIVPPTNAEVAG